MASPTLSCNDLAALEVAVRRALVSGLGGLEVLGYGETSCVLAWKGLACKRLPPFGSRTRFDSYQAVFESYLERLRQAGVPPIPSTLQTLAGPDETWIGYCLQPRIRREQLLSEVLRRASEETAAALLSSLLLAVRRCPEGQVGLDAQISNWGVSSPGDLLYLDVTTPFLRDETGRDALDTEIFVAALPALARGLVRRFLVRQILDRYYDHRSITVDLIANLANQGLQHLEPLCLDLANSWLTPRLTSKEVRAYRRKDTQIWRLAHGLLSFERFWYHAIRHQAFPFLLPERQRRA